MDLKKRRTLSSVRLESAEECLQSARTLLSAEHYKGAANRCYYAIFHAMRAVLALDEIDMKHHGGIISEFRRRYIKSGILERGLSDIITFAYDLRTDSDYNDFYVISRQDVFNLIEITEYFINTIQNYLNTVWT